MQKMRLNLDGLAVESFPTDVATGMEGTVDAYLVPTPPYASCGCTTGASYIARFCPAPSTRTTCRVD